LGAKLPALERNILKHRAMEMLLVMFYTEELKRDVKWTPEIGPNVKV